MRAPKLWRVSELCERLGFGKTFIREQLEKRRLGFVRIGREIRVPDDEVVKYLERYAEVFPSADDASADLG